MRIIAPMNIDLHVHTTFSDGRMTVPEIIGYGPRAGLDALCITDHGTMAAQHELSEGLQENGLYVFVGMEYATSDGDFLIFGPFEDLRPGLDALELLDVVRKRGGAAIVAHPFRKARPAAEYLVKNGHCRIIEGLNGRNSKLENLRVQLWRDEYPLVETAGSDAHTPDELGSYCTHFSIPIRSKEDLVFALNSGFCRPDIPSLHPLPIHRNSVGINGVNPSV